ncbi:FBD-associated F-box protein At3g49020 isoform X2 [Eutrema salsugineum]|uniref:FBD-associated F-box protein At3g49020 isoform X2 n=1 Tax=Eutrema salsugineum TaxID=72664 RepID=UPI000CED3BC0|nr:FBD-associated F-box protein At3g49020 isoform X2 [Eutrema salsugineum]
MEQRCKIGGESLRNRNSVNEDRISELPEALLLEILSSLPTENVIATSVLSKRWRSLWKMVPKLEFDSKIHKSEHHRFSEIVCRSLLSHKAPVLESLSLVVRDKTEALDIGIWVGIAFSHHVRKFVLDLWNKGERELHLYYVEFKDDESVFNLLCGCPTLQDLVVFRHPNMDMVDTFTIAVPSLQRLTIEENNAVMREGGYVINAPSLKYLNIKGFSGLECFLVENAPELVEAKIIYVSEITYEKILESLTSAKRLSLRISPLEIKYPTGIIFYRLLYLELTTNESEWWNLLSLMLDGSPQLQNLKLIDSWPYRDKDCLVDWKWNQPKRVPECLLLHLETFVWTKYEWQREEEKEVAAYILKNARRLKKATISTKPIESKQLEKLEKRREMLNELASEVKASVSCQLVFEADTFSYRHSGPRRVVVPHTFSVTLGTTEKE